MLRKKECARYRAPSALGQSILCVLRPASTTHFMLQSSSNLVVFVFVLCDRVVVLLCTSRSASCPAWTCTPTAATNLCCRRRWQWCTPRATTRRGGEHDTDPCSRRRSISLLSWTPCSAVVSQHIWGLDEAMHCPFGACPNSYIGSSSCCCAAKADSSLQARYP